MIVLLLLFLICTYAFVDYGMIMKEIAQMALGRLPVPKEFTILTGALHIIAICVLSVALAFATLVVVIPMAGYPKRETPEFASLKGLNLMVFLEELFARILLFWLPLHLSGYNIIVFYISWIVSNGIWALLHLINYEEQERSLWLVLPQFINGLFIESYAFLKFGFWVAYAVHLFYDFILFASIGREELKSSLIRNFPSRAAGIILGTLLIGVGTFSFSAFSAAIFQSPYLKWLDGNFVNNGITMLTFIGFLLIMVNVIGLVCDLAGMDESSVLNFLKGREFGFFEKRMGWILLHILGGMLIPIFLLIVYYLTSWILIPMINFFTPFQNIANATFLLSAFLISSLGWSSEDRMTSPSAEFRSFLERLPFFFLLFVYMTKVSFLALLASTIIYEAISGIVESFRLY